jgi:hypothetical protein
MNKQFKKLAQQSGIWFEDNKDIRTHSVSTTTLEKFAELIVRECGTVAGRDWDTAETAIYKHFGVEE